MRTKSPAWLVIVALVASACSGGGASDGDDPVNDPSALYGLTWVARSVELDGEDRPLAGIEPTIVFDEEGVGGFNGCNSYGGSVAFDDDRLAFGEMAATLRGCEADPSRVEREYMTALGRSDTWMLDGATLVLSASDGSARIVYGQPADQGGTPLAGEWQLDAITVGDVAMSVLARAPAELVIEAEGVSGTTGCNSFGGFIGFEPGGAIGAVDIANTEIGCEPDIMEQEGHILDILRGAVGYTLGDATLTIDAGDGRALVYRSVPA